MFGLANPESKKKCLTLSMVYLGLLQKFVVAMAAEVSFRALPRVSDQYHGYSTNTDEQGKCPNRHVSEVHERAWVTSGTGQIIQVVSVRAVRVRPQVLAVPPLDDVDIHPPGTTDIYEVLMTPALDIVNCIGFAPRRPSRTWNAQGENIAVVSDN